MARIFKIVTIFSFTLLVLMSLSSSALEYKSLLKEGVQLQYKHWNREEKKITGYTALSYEKVVIDGSPFFLEVLQNEKPDGTVFTRKQVWYGAEKGTPIRYVEEDFRKKIKVSNRYKKDKILTKIIDGKESKEFSVSMESDLIPFEVLPLHLRKKVPQLMKKEKIEFMLYLPLVAIELDKKGLPRGLSKISVTAKVEKREQGTVQVLIKPSSFFIRTLLPKEKSEFRFTFTDKGPYKLLSFEENVTKSILMRTPSDLDDL